MTKRPDKRATKRPVTAQVIPWEGLGWGVDVDHGDGKHDAYPVGPLEAAVAEARRLELENARDYQVR